ncbi:hypothetical protein IGL98_000392 [Enterococcus sp. DIV0840]|nr:MULTISPECIES: hypothetical protein [Enterococcus]MBO0435764.1 hypothetical protein [Enterococcus sp. DIV0849a]MBO0475166.1 hypothetical protein [Enterococcus ureasiticus]
MNTQNEVPSEFILDQITEQIERLKTEEQELLDLYSKKGSVKTNNVVIE